MMKLKKFQLHTPFAHSCNRVEIYTARFGPTPFSTKANNLKQPESTLNDHRTIAARQKLYTTSILTPGSIFFLPHGTRIYNRLVDFLRAQYQIHGFEEIITPLIFKKDLWEKSGHWQNYEKEIFRVEESRNVEDEHSNATYGLKPMNCPGHCIVYASTERSYKELPLRFADFSPLHRNEASGALSGLTRLRCFHQDDGHIFCSPESIKDEIKNTLTFVKQVYSLLGMNKLKLYLSTRPEEHIGSLDTWNEAENGLREALQESGETWIINEGDGAFYGPKIDVMVADARGKWHQTATIQLDFNLPQRFKLYYRTDAGDNAGSEKLIKQPVMIHRAIFGSLERFMGILIEHLNGHWPFWLSPRHAVILPVNQTDRILTYAKQVQKELSNQEVNESEFLPLNKNTYYVDINAEAQSIGKRLRESRLLNYNYEIVIGEDEVDKEILSVSSRHNHNSRDTRKMTIQQLKKEFIENVKAYR
ncbi:putative threonine--tRNA ligase, mitochondrial [Schizosaccharomyces pombe]|uniref:Probable threonine--tRNA ligase, mitochondrial n=1 Tax=Schizosaccharomyces pombe (strain 972 / ATCC 24843) TaxID=284812 RepID=SYTM_SCHPO|nr:putative threonine--tRNA (Thr) ligase [Schizosaccharomyces pombe]O13969.2 RecName: Full=Probable threonine--tRNA ligase, mitochondrial; AltName: Full=Threonyl-tRNA synthetase; Short=ThrRS; Flags: Precursor [Schizosaccharomyces pombe 972h-]CAB11266.2 mitochondrial threonine-tRNA ligase (predicted) [Schizosaccharomyces pombe]|eukprot:NP_594034.2 putative threonine--tRNA (Thr) ligase [Schizosaccharomyces pombe]